MTRFQFSVDGGPVQEAEVEVSIESSSRTCFHCGKALSAHAGFIETIAQPDGRRRDFCSRRCLRDHLTEDEL